VWEKWPIEMALKTVLHYAIRRGLVPLDERASRFLSKTDADDTSEVIDIIPEVPQLPAPSSPPKSGDIIRAALEEPKEVVDVFTQPQGQEEPEHVRGPAQEADDGQMPLT
jgi:recombinational DNA repair protein RecT